MISIVVPAYNEVDGIRTLYERVRDAAATWNDSFELVIVDDGSRDGTLEICRELAQQDGRVRIISLTRNFGHQAALTAGLWHAHGDIIAVIDADLQDPPEQLGRFIDKCREGYDVVYAVRTKRKEGLLKRIAYAAYYRLLARLAAIRIPLDSGDFCVMSRRALDALNALPERNRFVRGLRSWMGYRQIGLEYERSARLTGEPKYTFAKLVNLGLDGVFNFSFKPLRLIALTGIAVGCLAIAAAALFVYQYATDTTILGHNPRQARGWSSIIVAMLLLAAFQLFSLGILGEYLGRIFEEVKHRPTYLIGEAINIDETRMSQQPRSLPQGRREGLRSGVAE
jgi:polyisoprenyl-phosphate glycosyltransferase